MSATMATILATMSTLCSRLPWLTPRQLTAVNKASAAIASTPSCTGSGMSSSA